MADSAENVLRVIGLIDLLDLKWQTKQASGAAPAPGLTTVVRQLEAGLPRVADVDQPEARLSFATIYVYSSREADRPDQTERVVFRRRGTQTKQECSSCPGPCTHCRAATGDPGGRGHDNPIAADLLELARKDAYDWAVIVSSDTWLIPVVRYLQSHGRKIVHGCFPPIARDLTKACWASIDLGSSLEDSHIA